MSQPRHMALLAVWMVLASTLPGLAQSTAPPAVLTGIVLTTDDTPKPVRRAIVSLWGGTHPLGHHTVTDDEGKFGFVGVPAGRYQLSATRASFVSIAHGATRPGWPGTPLVLRAGERVDNVTVLMARGAAITGSVTNAEGEPIPDLTVRVEQSGGPSVPGSTRREVQTDEHGVYRVFGLAAGRYIVSARPAPSGAARMTEPQDAEVDRLLALLRNRSVPGRTAPVTSAESVTTPFSDFVPVYHPSSFDPGDAAPVRLAQGEERSADILVRLMPITEIAGQVLRSDAQPLTGIELTLTRLAGQAVTERASAPVLPDGSFRFSSVAPGRYRIVAQATARAGEACRFASAELLVAGSPLSGLSLPLRTCLKIVGRVQFAGVTRPAPASAAGFRVRLDPAAPHEPSPVPSLHPSVVTDAAGRFLLGEHGEVGPGQFYLQIDLPQGESVRRWYLQSLTADSRDILDLPLEIGDDSSQTIAVSAVFTDEPSSLTGNLKDGAGRPATELTVLVFPTNREWWRGPFRRVRTTRPASDGSFDFPDLPPGDYHLAALADVAPGEWFDPAFLSDMAKVALSLSVRPGERKVQDLRIAK